MVGAHVHEFRLARLALLLPVLSRPDQHRAQRVRITRTVEEIVRRRFGLAAGAGRIGQLRRIGRRDIWDLVVGDEAGERLGIGGSPAENSRDLDANPFLVLTYRARYLVAVVDRIDVDPGAVHPAVLVDPGHGVGRALSKRY